MPRKKHLNTFLNQIIIIDIIYSVDFYDYCDESKPYLLSTICGHHNEEGYKVIVQKIFDFITTHPRYKDYRGNNEGKIKNQWLGPIQNIPRKSYKL